MKINKRIAVAALGVLALGGVGAGVANASSLAPLTSITDTATPGDTADAAGGADVQEGDQTGPDAPGAAETP